MPRTHLTPWMAAAAFAAVLAACSGGDGGTGPTPQLGVTATGRAERSMDIVLAVTDAGAAVPAGQVTWTVTPAGAATVAADGTAHLAAAGSVKFTASAGGHTGSTTVDVALPPTVVFARQNGNTDIWKVALDGGELTQLTTNASDDESPT
ncbi:MAG TPA: hypothetical protein VFH27_07955, partial [Longimicrobiaceae bacterium]|nr:hypothetical protein [Longimicrobiaceae bacterium]